MSIHDNIQKTLEYWDLLGFTPHNYGLDGGSAIGMFNFEVESLLWACSQTPEGAAVEVGSFCGGATCLLGLYWKFANKGLVHSVDITHTDWGNAFQRNVYRKARLNNVMTHTGAHNDKEWLRYLSDVKPKISLVLDDHFHSFRAVLETYEILHDYLVDGAIYLVHDNHKDFPSVSYGLPNQGASTTVEFLERANANFDRLMGTEVTAVDTTNLSSYHAAEQHQDFWVSEAVAYICDKYGHSLINLPPTKYQPRTDMAGEWKLGKTSPYNALRAFRINK